MKRCFVIALLFLLTAALLAADDKPKPNTLTPKEIADGWILLFDGETTFGWTADNYAIKVVDGALEFGGKKRTLARAPISAVLSNYELTCETAAVFKGASEVNGWAGF